MPAKKISAAAIQALKEALAKVYWYKSDLRSFLTHCLSDPDLLSRINWNEYKRNIVATLVNHLARSEEVYQRDLLRLMTETCEISDFSHLRKLDDGEKKASEAEMAVEALREQIKGYRDLQEEEKAAEERRKRAHEKMMKVNAVQEELNRLKEEFFSLVSADDPQQRGFSLEKVLAGLFTLFELDSKASFRNTGEQIDGAFSFEGIDYLLEAKWQKEPVSAKELDSLAGKLSRKLDNTLGLFLSVNGFSEDAVKVHSSGRRLVILMDGSDLMAVLEGRCKESNYLKQRQHKIFEIN